MYISYIAFLETKDPYINAVITQNCHKCDLLTWKINGSYNMSTSVIFKIISCHFFRKRGVFAYHARAARNFFRGEHLFKDLKNIS